VGDKKTKCGGLLKTLNKMWGIVKTKCGGLLETLNKMWGIWFKKWRNNAVSEDRKQEYKTSNI